MRGAIWILVMLLAGCTAPGSGPAMEAAAPDDAAPGAGDAAGGGADAEAAPGAGSGTEPEPEPETGSEAAETRLLEVSAWDLTSGALQAPRSPRIEVDGQAAWTPDIPSYGNAGPHAMGQHEVGKRLEGALRAYPDGPDGAVCEVDIRMTADMVNESAEAITQVEFYDAEIWIYGLAVPGHMGWESAKVCPR